MIPEKHDDDLAYEQSVNERYLREAESSANDAWRGLDTVAAPTNTGWTGDGPKKPRPKGPAIPLIGRVALATDDEGLGRSFYVGGGFTPLPDGITVVSWAAGAARLFYEGRDAQSLSPEGIDSRNVAARRTFSAKGHHLVDFEDECEPDVEPESVFSRPARLAISVPPSAPGTSRTRPRKPSRDERAQSYGSHTTDRNRLPSGERQTAADSRVGGAAPLRSWALPAQPNAGATATRGDVPGAGNQEEQPLQATSAGGGQRDTGRKEGRHLQPTAMGAGKRRADRLLVEALKAPKTGELAPVLSTLQPEQYRLVTWTAGENLVVQGHPGTGKTIVAAHRAAFLVLPKDRESEGPRLHKVALVGPTDRWKGHIQPTVMKLVDESVQVLSLQELVRTWAPRGSAQALHPTDEGELQSLWGIGRIVDRAAGARRRFHSQLRPAERVRELVNCLAQDTETHRKYARNEGTDLSEWLLAAENYDRARRNPSYLLFLAAASIATAGTGPHGGLQHIVVDEAQDIRPIEWWMLTRMYRAGTEARWSLFGDMNQRRSDFTWDSWEKLTDLLELCSVDGELLEPEQLGDGYRSTREILRYAAALLPRGMRSTSTLRSGPEPAIRRVGPKQLADKAMEAAERLAIRYHQGSVAVIAWAHGTVTQIERALLRQGWRKDTAGGRWLQRPHRSCRLSIIRPVEARGLEFDAVIVVEPADFKPNLGRHGELYTSLTRANQELVVVHSKAMPRELAGRGNRVGQFA